MIDGAMPMVRAYDGTLITLASCTAMRPSGVARQHEARGIYMQTLRVLREIGERVVHLPDRGRIALARPERVVDPGHGVALAGQDAGVVGDLIRAAGEQRAAMRTGDREERPLGL